MDGMRVQLSWASGLPYWPPLLAPSLPSEADVHRTCNPAVVQRDGQPRLGCIYYSATTLIFPWSIRSSSRTLDSRLVHS